MIETRESVTAKLCSFARAFHSNIERNKIFDDYLAYDLMGKDEFEKIGQLIQNDFDAEKSESLLQRISWTRLRSIAVNVSM